VASPDQELTSLTVQGFVMPSLAAQFVANDGFTLRESDILRRSRVDRPR